MNPTAFWMIAGAAIASWGVIIIYGLVHLAAGIADFIWDRHEHRAFTKGLAAVARQRDEDDA